MYGSDQKDPALPIPYSQLSESSALLRPCSPPSYIKEQQPLTHTQANLRIGRANTQCMKKFLEIYQDRTVKRDVQQSCPTLTPEQLLERTRQAKETRMDKEGKKVFDRELPDAKDDERTALTKSVKKYFFDEKVKESDCGWENNEEGKHIRYYDAYKNFAFNNRWAFDEPVEEEKEETKEKEDCSCCF